MRNVVSQLLEDKMDDAVSHYINSHQASEPVHVEGNSLALNIQDDAGGRVVTVMHSQGFSSQMCRQVGEQVADGHWGEELLDADGKLAAIVAHLAQHSKSAHHKEQQQDGIVVHVPPLPPLQDMKRCPDPNWYNKSKTTLKVDDPPILQQEPVLELAASASPATKQQSKKSLPHKKRISKKLKRNTGNSTPQQDIVVINWQEQVPQEEILPDNFVTAVQHPEHLPEETHHITHEVRPILICQICGEFYGDEQLKFYHHLKQHYEPHATIIIENPVPDLGIDKMTNTCIVDNVASLPDSIVELSLENTVPKTMYQPIDKHILYTSSDKTLTYNKVQYSMASMDKDVASDPECNKIYRKQKQCDTNFKDQHSSANSKLENMGEFSEPEDLMEGIHVAVDEGTEQYDPALLPHLTVDSGHVHQDHVRNWYMRAAGTNTSVCECVHGYCELCAPPAPPLTSHVPTTHAQVSHAQVTSHAQVSHAQVSHAQVTSHTVMTHADVAPQEHELPAARTVVKDEVLQRIFDSEVQQNDNEGFAENILPDADLPPEPDPPQEKQPEQKSAQAQKKPTKRFECNECHRVFLHRNSLFYHTLMHSERPQQCKECGKSFYTASALKIHKRTHNGERPCKCDECGRDFRQWSDLKYHKASIHSDQKQFKCEFCGKEFARRYSLSVHRRIHTGERNYKCDYCAKTFRASSYRLSHMRTHTGSKPHPCTICDKAFRVAYDLRRHMLIHDKVRVRGQTEQKKAKDTKDKDKKSPQQQNSNQNIKEEAVASPQSSETEPKKKIIGYTVLKGSIEKKQTKSKKPQKKGAPNVTVNSNRSEGQFKMNVEYGNNVEVFDTRQSEEVKRVYTDQIGNFLKKDTIPPNIVRLGTIRLTDEREMAMLRPIFRDQNESENERLVFREPTTDGKLQVFTEIDKGKEYTPISSNIINSEPQTISDIREVVRERTEGEVIENSLLFERLTALYNIPAV